MTPRGDVGPARHGHLDDLRWVVDRHVHHVVDHLRGWGGDGHGHVDHVLLHAGDGVVVGPVGDLRTARKTERQSCLHFDLLRV